MMCLDLRAATARPGASVPTLACRAVSNVAWVYSLEVYSLNTFPRDFVLYVLVIKNDTPGTGVFTIMT